ncbi:NHLP leader peptide family natural product precursor [Candidatus Methylospira mobilis]|uniref:NHLP leader peptide family natural product n=1 Tax=Candidatus Methylospira mobilis TaxID=1808979 RepID=A0A5Q0BMA1_9GAMM|nr:NHLP leader peptide family RiPP precursor [Candidatus Methylospira mobilis]QFY43237.1 NHLP leader peptide family natural product precursor [Candidatus Methylospira mobilis]
MNNESEVQNEEDAVIQEEQKFQKIIAKCWRSPDFKAELMANPAETLRKEGLEPQEGVSVMVVEDTEKLFHLVIPYKPEELSEEDLNDIVGGSYGVVMMKGLSRAGAKAMVLGRHGNPALAIRVLSKTAQSISGGIIAVSTGLGLGAGAALGLNKLKK